MQKPGTIKIIRAALNFTHGERTDTECQGVNHSNSQMMDMTVANRTDL
jgi:hypothetical protein